MTIHAKLSQPVHVFLQINHVLIFCNFPVNYTVIAKTSDGGFNIPSNTLHNVPTKYKEQIHLIVLVNSVC